MTGLLNVDVAREKILAGLPTLPNETVNLPDALGRVLASDIIADVDLPPFANSSMDGYAVQAADTTNATRSAPIQLRVSMDIPAGIPPQGQLVSTEAARIMTGALLPDGADTIIPVEDTDSNWKSGDNEKVPEYVAIYRSLKSGDYVRPAGEDISKGQKVLTTGTLIRAAEIGVLAALGWATVPNHPTTSRRHRIIG